MEHCLMFQNTRKSRLQILSKCKFHSNLGWGMLLMYSSLAFRMAFFLRYNIWGSKLLGFGPKSMCILMKLGRNFSRGGLFLVVCEGVVLNHWLKCLSCRVWCVALGSAWMALASWQWQGRAGKQKCTQALIGSLFWYISLIVMFPFGSSAAQLKWQFCVCLPPSR